MYARGFVAGAALLAAIAQAPSSGAQDRPPTVTVYKSATCGCCSKWIDHLRANGFTVSALDVDDVESIKAQYGVPARAGSCHTALVDGYVVEGHVPADSVKRLLAEKPKIAGIAVPGMPLGSPGMEVPSGRVDRYDVLAFDRSGAVTVFERR